jgi:hypothetical protein
MHQRGWLNRVQPWLFTHHQKIHHPAYRDNFEVSNPIEYKDIGITIPVFKSTILAMIPLGLFGFFVTWTGAITLWFVLLAHHLLWNVIHSHMHKAEQPWKRFRLYRFFYNYHLMHHFYPRNNYNVICILADFILGSYKKPSDEDKKKFAN